MISVYEFEFSCLYLSPFITTHTLNIFDISDSDPPTVYVTPGNSSIHVHRHDNVTLECSFVSLTNITSFKWTKHGQTGQTIIAEITHFSGVSHSVPLVMFDFIPEDVGTYQCNVSNENGENDDKVSILIFEGQFIL